MASYFSSAVGKVWEAGQGVYNWYHGTSSAPATDASQVPYVAMPPAPPKVLPLPKQQEALVLPDLPPQPIRPVHLMPHQGCCGDHCACVAHSVSCCQVVHAIGHCLGACGHVLSVFNC